MVSAVAARIRCVLLLVLERLGLRMVVAGVVSLMVCARGGGSLGEEDMSLDYS